MQFQSISHLPSSSNLCNNSATCNLNQVDQWTNLWITIFLNTIQNTVLFKFKHSAATTGLHKTLRTFAGMGGRNRAYQTGKTERLHNPSLLHRLAYNTENTTLPYQIIPKTQAQRC